MKRSDALPYVSFCLNECNGERSLDEMPANARLVGWQCGFEPLFVAVWSCFGSQLDDTEAEEIATNYLAERNWFSGEPKEADYVM